MKPRLTVNLIKIRHFALILALVLVTGNIGYRLGKRNLDVSVSSVKQVVVGTGTPENREVDFSLFWDVWGRLEQRYIDRGKLDPQKMVYGAIGGMVEALGDPYTVFLAPKENEEYKQDLNGSFEGIGAQLGAKGDKIVVIAPLKGHPAEKAGVVASDWIVKVNEEETYGWTVPQAVAKIRGEKGTTVRLTVMREGREKPLEFSIVRDTIIVKSVEFEVKQLGGDMCKSTTCPEVAYLKLIRFGDKTNDEWNSAVAQVRRELSRRSSVSGVILDLRNNPGGYLQSSIFIAAEFLRSGVVVVQENSDGTKETYSVNRVGNLLDVPLVVLINKGSASAAEIVAGALKDHQRAKLVGETTFGKGSIQTPEDLPDGSGVHITTARWILPEGEWIDGKGIKPDFELKNPDATDAADLQLERAIEELVK